MTRDELIIAMVLYVLFPLWMLVSVGDYLCHRISRIEDTSSTGESWQHLLQVGEIGVPLLAALLLQIDAAVLVVLLLAALAHTATAYTDFAYAAGRRHISATEQFIHAFLVGLPLMVLLLLLVLHSGQFLALIGLGSEPADFSIRLKNPPLPLPTVLGVLGAGVLFVVLPFAEEYLRCLRARRRGAT